MLELTECSMYKFIQIGLLLLILSSTLAQSFYNTDSLERALSQKNDPLKKMEILSELADLLLTYDPDRALLYAQQTLEIAEINNNYEFKLRAYLQMSEIYLSKTNLRQSMELAFKSQNLAENLDKEKEYAEALILISKIYTELGDYEKSADLNYQALKIFEEYKDEIGKSKVLSQIGYLYSQLENWDKSLEYDLQAYKIAKDNNDLIGIARGLNNIAAVYSRMGEFENFISSIKEAIEINKKIGHKLWEGINYTNLGVINLLQKNYDTSLFYYQKAEVIFEELNNSPKLAIIYIGYSAYYSEISDFEKSLLYAKKALDLGERQNLKMVIYEAAQRLHQIYLHQDDYANAYKYNSIEFMMKDSLDFDRSMTKLSQLELLYEYEKLELEEKNKRTQREYVYIIIGTILTFLLVLVALVLNNRRRVERIKGQKLKAELNIRNKELTSNVVTLMRKNEILSDISDKLLEIRNSAAKEETKSAIVKIANELQKTTDTKIGEEFDLRFKQVHGEFYNELLKRFPDLTPNEQKICAFLRLNMTTKEISELTGQRINTIEIARTRLRKKLGIANTSTNLINFLSQI